MESIFAMAVHFRDAVSSDVDPVDVGTLRCAPLSMPGQEFGERAISTRQSGIVASTDVANHICHAIVVEINELYFLWMTDSYLPDGWCYQCLLGTELPIAPGGRLLPTYQPDGLLPTQLGVDTTGILLESISDLDTILSKIRSYLQN